MTRARGTGLRKEAGSALLIVTMITVILTLLGISYLALADQENNISINQRNADQLTFVAESGARMVKAWFDRPIEGDPNNPIFKFMGDYDMRRMGFYDRSQRVFDHDDDPNTADVLADGTSGKPYFRQGMLVSADPNYLSFWDKPYRGSNVSEYRGSEAGPDIVMESASSGSAFNFLDIVNMRVVSQNKTVQETVGRIQKIEVYAPPIIEIGGIRTRYGIATVKVTSAKFKHMGKVGIIPVVGPQSIEVGRQVTKMVINEVPYPGPAGPFHTCSNFDINGNVQIHWGQIIAGNAASPSGFTGTLTQLVDRTWRTVPWDSVSKIVTGTDLTNWVNANDGLSDTDFDPWFQLRAGGGIFNAPDPNAIQLFPYVPPTTPSNDQTALFQNSPSSCPDWDYQIWKNVALSGGQNIHYMVYMGAADSYAEDGTGTAQDLATWTDGQEGFWFFDTTDRLPPDPNGSNIAPAVSQSGSWNSAGFIYLNADWDSSGTGGGATRVIIPPGEPWEDADGDGTPDQGEWVNLEYGSSLADTMIVHDYDPNGHAASSSVTSANGVVYSGNTDPNYNDSGLPFTDTIAFQGVLYIEGIFEFTGNMDVFGALVTKGGMITTSAGTPDVWFDERLVKGGWPPPELNLPRTMITFWETDL